MDYEYSRCNFTMIALIDLKLQRKIMMKYLITH